MSVKAKKRSKKNGNQNQGQSGKKQQQKLSDVESGDGSNMQGKSSPIQSNQPVSQNHQQQTQGQQIGGRMKNSSESFTKKAAFVNHGWK